jgi:hypothetical protein
MAKDVDLNLNVNTGNLKQQLREAQQEVQKLTDKFGATSREAIEAAKRAADLKDRIGDAKALTDAFNPDAKFKALAGAANIAAGALAGFEGAMGLVGVQSEDAQKAILKVQSALALSQGLNALQEIPDTFRNIKAVAINAFNAIKGAIGATGIGLLVIALGALYANWDALRKLVGDSIPALKEGTKTFDKLKEVFFGVGNAIVQYLITPFKAVLKILKLDFKGAIQEIKNGADVIGNYEKGAAKERQDQNDAYAKARLQKQIKNKENEIAIAKASGKDSYNLEKDNLHRKLILNKGNQEELDKIRQEERVLDATHKKSLEDKQKAHNDELKKKRDEASAEEKRKREEAEKERAEFQKAKNRAAEEEYDAILKREEEAREKNRQGGLTEIEQVNEKYNKLIQTAKDAGVSTIELEIEQANAINDIKLSAQQKQYDSLKEAAEKEAALDLAIREAKRNALDTGLNILLQFAGKNKTIALGILAIQKGLAIADIVVGASKSIAAAQAALAATPAVIGVVPNPMYAVQAAATVKGIALTKITAATSIASILAASIGQAKSITGGDSGGGGSAPSGGGGSAAPQFNVVGNSGVNQLAETMQGRSAQAPIQAYVVANDVTTAQGLNRNIVTNASLG